MFRGLLVALAAACMALAFGRGAMTEGYADPAGGPADPMDTFDGLDFGDADSSRATPRTSLERKLLTKVPSWVSMGKQRDAQQQEHETNRRVVAAANRAGTTFDLVMYGDSITAYHMKDKALWDRYFKDLRGAVPLAMGGATVAELAARIIDRGENLTNDPRTIVLLIGINDLRGGEPDPTPRLDFLVQWLQAAHPASRVFVMALVVNRDVDVGPTNARYRALADKRGVEFIDCPKLDLKRHFSDGTHPNAAGQDIMLKCIRAAITKPRGTAPPPADAPLPPPSDLDKAWCKTWMSDPNDTGECFALVYHHCVDGMKDQARIPAAIAKYKDSALKQIYATQKNCEESGNKCFPDGPPKDWTSLCVARPELAGKDKCKKVTPDEWRVWVQGADPRRDSECEFPTVYVKSHFRSGSIQDQYTGKHGRG